MRRLSQFCALMFGVVALMALTSDMAEARRGVRIGMLVPSFTKPESVIKVLELPNIPAFTDPKGRHVDLGYYWPSIGEGQWVGMTSETSYYKWSPDAVLVALRLAKVSALPPVPERPTDLSAVGGWGGIFWIVLIGIGLLTKLYTRGTGTATTPVEGSQTANQPREEDAWVKRAEAAIAPAAARNPVSSGVPLRSPRVSTLSSATAAGVAPRAAFGRR